MTISLSYKIIKTIVDYFNKSVHIGINRSFVKFPIQGITCIPKT